MIISHKNRFIFIKTAKTAGTSIEIALSRFCGPQDVITPVLPEDERIRRDLGYPGPQNFWAPVKDYGVKDVARFLLKRRPRKRFYNHMSAREVKHYLGPGIWDEYYTFCVERNPWDRALSLYYWHYRQAPRPSLREFLDSHLPRILKQRGFELYTIDGEIAVDRVCFYEDLNRELDGVRERLGLPQELVLPRAKTSYRTKKRNYREEFTTAEARQVEELFAQEIRLFGYRF